MDYQSERTVESAAAPGVRFTIARMSFGRRVELTRQIWELAGKVEFLQAGEDPRERLEAALLTSEVERAYVKWGLLRIEGLTDRPAGGNTGAYARAGPAGICAGRSSERSRASAVCRKKNEKTESRLSLPVLKPSRVEVRRMPEETAGDPSGGAAVCAAQPEAAPRPVWVRKDVATTALSEIVCFR